MVGLALVCVCMDLFRFFAVSCQKITLANLSNSFIYGKDEEKKARGKTSEKKLFWINVWAEASIANEVAAFC